MSAEPTTAAEIDARTLRRLARLYGVQSSYTDIGGTRREADRDALRAVLRANGADLDEGAPAAVRARTLELHRRELPPVVVAWTDGPLTLTLRRAPDADPPVCLRIEPDAGEPDARRPDAGEPLTLDVPPERMLASRVETRAGEPRLVQRMALPHALAPGYYRLRLEPGSGSARLIVAPARVFQGTDALREGRAWGVFLPVHAIRRHEDDGAGDLDALSELFDWVADHGGHAVGVLPLLALFLDEPFEPSPYSPASRLIFSELWLGGGDTVPGGPAPADGASEDAASPQGGGSDPGAADAPLVDYRAVAQRRHRRLSAEAERAFRDGEPAELAAFRRRRPDIDAYARFIATVVERGEVWHVWPQRLKDGELREGDWDQAAYRYQLYAHWRLDQRLEALARRTRERGAGLYLDLPLGAHPDGFDAWRHRGTFASGVSVGAPPDPFFTGGQDWGFPPLRPDAMLATGMEYTIATVRAQLRYAGVLRLDHIMALHRQFWVPHGMVATRGVYVRYPARAFYAVLAIESHAARAAVVGEDLGTVPAAVRSAMTRHGVRGMHVGQFDADAGRHPVTGRPADGSVASLNTHDMPTFAAFWTGRDLRQREEQGLLEPDEVASETESRRRLRQALAAALGVEPSDRAAALEAWLETLARSDAALVLVNLEDLWGETEPQNVPGTWRELPNWRRRARRTLEQIRTDQEIARVVDRVDALRRGKDS